MREIPDNCRRFLTQGEEFRKISTIFRFFDTEKCILREYLTLGVRFWNIQYSVVVTSKHTAGTSGQDKRTPFLSGAASGTRPVAVHKEENEHLDLGFIMQLIELSSFPSSLSYLLQLSYRNDPRHSHSGPPIFEKLWRARSPLYRSRILRPRSHFSAFFEIYKICLP